MRVHRNAKTTFKMRQLIVTRAQQGWTYAQIADALGISVRTVAKWIGRARQPEGLVDGSSLSRQEWRPVCDRCFAPRQPRRPRTTLREEPRLCSTRQGSAPFGIWATVRG